MVIRVGRDNRAVIEAVVVTTPGPEPRVITLSGHPEWSSERNAFVDSGAAA